MNILAIDTATESCSVALATTAGVEELVEVEANAHSRLVLDMVRQLLAASDLRLADLDAIAVDIGPGSFTGLRIGIGVTQGLAYGSGLKVIPVGSLAALAAEVVDGPVISAIDARMKQVYWALFGNGVAGDPLLPASVDYPENITASPALATAVSESLCGSESITAIGSGWQAYASQMPACLCEKSIIVMPQQFPRAATVARLALDAGSTSMVSPLDLIAAYVRNNIAEKKQS